MYKMLTRLRAKLLNIKLSNDSPNLNFNQRSSVRRSPTVANALHSIVAAQHKKPSEKQQLQWLQDNYLAIHLAIQQVNETEIYHAPKINELVYCHKINRLGCVPLKVAKRLLEHPILTCNNINPYTYYKGIFGTFFFVCKEFLKFFGHSKHIIVSQLKEVFRNWEYNLDERVKVDIEISRKSIFSIVYVLKNLDNIFSSGVKDDVLDQNIIMLENCCLYFLSVITLKYKQIKSMQQQESNEMKVDLKIFHIDLEHPFDYTPKHVREYLFLSERMYEYQLNHFQLIVKSNWIQEKPEECPVCFEEMGCEKHLSCGHYVHKKCVIKSKKTCCPMCKGEIELDPDELKTILSE